MATFSKIKLSGSTDGRGVKVVATATAGTTIHTAVSGSSSYDELWLYAVNSQAAATAATVKLTIEFGGTTAPDDLIEFFVPAEDGLYLIVPGLILQNASVVKAFAATANVIMMHGWVNRIV